MLSDDVAIVTGGSMGIGKAIAAAYVEQGADPVVVDIDDDAGTEAATVSAPNTDTATSANTNKSSRW